MTTWTVPAVDATLRREFGSALLADEDHVPGALPGGWSLRGRELFVSFDVRQPGQTSDAARELAVHVFLDAEVGPSDELFRFVNGWNEQGPFRVWWSAEDGWVMGEYTFATASLSEQDFGDRLADLLSAAEGFVRSHPR